MSIVESLKKIVDPVQARQREEELRKEREQPKREHSGDPPRYVCRICGHTSEDKVVLSRVSGRHHAAGARPLMSVSAA